MTQRGVQEAERGSNRVLRGCETDKPSLTWFRFVCQCAGRFSWGAMELSRRDFLSLMASVASVLTTPVVLNQSLRRRKNISLLSAAELAEFRSGVSAMRALAIADFKSWLYQANVHRSRPGDDAGVPDASTYWNQCVHGSEVTHFLDWHR